ncbi:hypothetical protein [Sphingomonas sp.]|uniref:hypothetical protein n=1 Tax=Sphingomonas sp. TaxID=28214 RepID=UPI0035BC7507
MQQDVRHAVMALVETGFEAREDTPDSSAARFQVRVARTFYKTSLRATEALGTSSMGMLIMLLDLFVAHEQGHSVSVSSLCIASGGAPTTALRQIGQLEARGFVTRRGDERDRRRCWIHPTPPAIDLVRSLVEEWATAL